jgi:hypothetical protein
MFEFSSYLYLFIYSREFLSDVHNEDLVLHLVLAPQLRLAGKENGTMFIYLFLQN